MAFKDPNTQLVISPIVDSLDKVDEKYRELYAETTDGKFQLRAELAFQSDFENTRNALQKERENSKKADKKLKELQSLIDSYDGIDPTAAKGMRTELETFKHNESDIGKIQALKAELEIKYGELKGQYDEIVKVNEGYVRERKANTLRDRARQALKHSGMPDYALDDGLMYAERMLEISDEGSIRVKKDSGLNTVYPEGVAVETWAGILKKEKPHLFGGSIGGGAGGSSEGSIAIEDWVHSGINGGINVTQLAKAASEDPKATLAMAKRAGVYDEVVKRFPYLFPKGVR